MAEHGGAPAPGVPYLCLDMIYEILLRVPAVYLHRTCRNVCRAWRHLLDEEDFIATYSKLRSPMPLFLYRRNFHDHQDLEFVSVDLADLQALGLVDLQAVDLAAREHRQVLGFSDVHEGYLDTEDGRFYIRGSCDGIIFLSDMNLHHLYACNPCTRHWARLPRCPLVAIYPHGPLGEGREYRILQVHDGAGPLSTTYSIRVLGAPEQQAVRPIGRPTSPAMPQELAMALDKVLADGLRAHRQGPPLMLHGTLHWLPTYQACGLHGYKLVAFDTAVEQFRWIAPPPALADPQAVVETDEVLGISAFQLLELDGKLAIAIMDERPGTVVNVWVLDDYLRQVWVQMHEVHVLRPEIRDQSNYDHDTIPPLYIAYDHPSRQLHALVPCPNDLLQCDAHGAVLQYHWRPHHWIICTGHLFRESFLRPAFLSWQGNAILHPHFRFQQDMF